MENKKEKTVAVQQLDNAKKMINHDKHGQC